MICPKAGGMYFRSENAGCALGMAAVARGCRFVPVDHPMAESERRTLNSEAVWGEWMLKVVERPCTCWSFQAPREMRIKDVIAHLFDRHVEGKRDWNLAQLVAWVETVEPVEIAPPPSTPVQMEPWKSVGMTTRAFLPPSEIKAIAEEIRKWQAVRDCLALKKKIREADQNRLALALSSATQEKYFN